MSSQSVDTKSLLVHEKTILHNSVTICGSGCGRGLVVNTPAYFNNKVVLKDDIDLGGTLKVDNIEEKTLNNGILIDGFRVKDGTAYVNDDPLCEVENKCNKDQPNGYAGLDSGGKVPISSLASQPLIFKGCWDANTNTPPLMSGVGTNGDYYIVCVGGSTNLDGYNNWSVGDAAVFTAGMPGMWTRLDNVDEVVSVNGQTGIVSLALDDLTDVTVPAPSTGQGLYYDGSNWVNTAVVRTIEGVSPALPSGNIDLVAGPGITITPGVNSITLSAPGGGISPNDQCQRMSWNELNLIPLSVNTTINGVSLGGGSTCSMRFNGNLLSYPTGFRYYSSTGSAESGIEYSNIYTCRIGYLGGAGSTVYNNFSVSPNHIRGLLFIAEPNGASSPLTVTTAPNPLAFQSWTQVGSTFTFAGATSPINWNPIPGTFTTTAPVGNDARGIIVDLGSLTQYTSITISLNAGIQDGIDWALGEEVYEPVISFDTNLNLINEKALTFQNGIEIGDCETTADGNELIALGKNAFCSGTRSMAIGYDATAFGIDCISIGSFANTRNSKQIAIGNNALFFLHHPEFGGSDNTIIGHDAGYDMVSGSFNIGIGGNVYKSYQSILNNVAIGYEAMRGVEFTTGVNPVNVANVTSVLSGVLYVGMKLYRMDNRGLVTLRATIISFGTGTGGIGTYNLDADIPSNAVYVGVLSEPLSNNVAVGYKALTRTGVGELTGIGANSLRANTTGIKSVGIGYNSLLSNTTGSSNTVVGHSAGDTITTGTGNVLVGEGTDTAAVTNNTVVLGTGSTSTSNGNVVVGQGSTDAGNPNVVILGSGATGNAANQLVVGSGITTTAGVFASTHYININIGGTVYKLLLST
jgi:hypothetical protein